MDPETQKEIQKIWDAIGELGSIPDHLHDGNDTSRVNFVSIAQKKFWVPHTIYGTDAATAGFYNTFFIAPVACYVNAFKEVHSVLGTDGGAVSVTLEKLTGTTAPGSGIALLSTALSLKSTINTVQSGTIVNTSTASVKDKSLAIGDRLALLKAGTLTSVANVNVLVELVISV